MKICILGGGTAGWMAALYIQKRQPAHEITVIDCSRIGIIGTGEGSTGVFADTIKNLFGISTEDFLVNTGATQKLGNRFTNWRGDGRSFIAPLDNTKTAGHAIDTSLLYHCKYHDRNQAHLTTQCGVLAEHGLTSVRVNAKEIIPVHSYHFDGHQVGAYFKQLSLALGSTTIDSEYRNCTRGENGNVTSITLVNEQTIAADVFIDATGFARILGQEIDAGWHSYSDSLTCDRAMPFQLPHLDKIEALTEAHALDSGWMWRIPVQERRGCGYVFDSDFITPDQAQAEIEQTLGCAIDPIKVIKFDPGRVERTFVNNVVSIGLAGNFLEPLQATNIHGTITQLYCLTEFWLRPEGIAGPRQTEHLNQMINRGLDHFADLLQTHYHGGRTDTEFWRYQQSVPLRPRLAMLKEMGEHRWPTAQDWDTVIGGVGYGVSIYPMIEYGWLDGAIARETFDHPDLVKEQYEQELANINQIRLEAMDNTLLVNRLRQGGIGQRSPLPANLNRLLNLGR